MQGTIPRVDLLTAVQTRLEESPVVALLGARQVGKTTLARQVTEKLSGAVPVTWFDLEQEVGRRALLTTPELTLASLVGLVVIDEIQTLPNLFSVLRPLCDRPERKATFLLLGSAAPDLIRGASESLAGRVQFVRVPGFAQHEVGAEQQDTLWLRGGLPRSFLATSLSASWRWREGFRETFLQRDLAALGVNVAPAALQRFWTMLAHYHGQIWNAAELGRSMGFSPNTANHYRVLLEGTYLIRVLQPWHENLAKRQVKAPKVYVRDSGLLHLLLGIETALELQSHPRYGASWEGFGLEQCLARFGDNQAWFWHTQGGAELDLLLLRHGKRWGFEFKCVDAPSTTRSMHVALADLGLEHLWVVYPGTAQYPLTDRITALPLRSVSGLSLTSEAQC